MAILGMDGFDHYTTDTAGTTVPYELDDVENYSLELLTTNTRCLATDTRLGTGKYLALIYSNADLRISLGTSISKTMYFSGAVRFKTGWGAFELLNFRDNDDSQTQINMWIDASGKMAFYRGASTLVAGPSSNAFSLDTWYWLEVKMTIGTATGVPSTYGAIEVRVNGSAWINATDINTQAISQTNPIGAIWLQGGNTTDVDFDDIVWQDDNGDFLGDSRIETFMPTTDVTGEEDFTNSTGTDSFELVNEQGPNGDTDYIYSATPDHQTLFEIGTITDTDSTIHGVGVHWKAKKTDTGARAVQSRTYADSGADLQGGTARNLATDYVTYTDIFETSDGSTTWTKTLIDDARFGVKVTT